uniref:Polymerase PB2 n=1 Tax=Coleopteran orthomyxo-related virus OKIAV158 TaxID=2746261 RepID=A0A7D7FDY1_9ORTO|nr:polymerase PB2 [Coleopteran orthomyxo-related virus OKIAV158]
MPSGEETKKYLMNIIKSINRANPQTIEILRNQPMCNIKLIERSSKNTKDPNPLMTTMSTMSQKYPISIDKTRAEMSKIPHAFLGVKDGKYIYDSHRHNRILCKKEAIEWWIENSNLPSDKTIKVIDILFQTPRKDVEAYYNVEWKSVRIGTVNTERKLISTRTPLIKADKPTREKAVERLFFPLTTIAYDPIPDSMMTNLKALVDDNLATNISLPSQIRIFLNLLDPKNRVLPLPSNFDERLAPMKHALMGSNFVCLHNFKTPVGNGNQIERLTTITAKCMIQNIRTIGGTEAHLAEAISKTTILSTSLTKILINTPLKETPEIKVLKTALKLPIIMETENDGLTTSPMPTKILPIFRQNLKGQYYRVYLGEEIVYFKFKDIRGQFTHNGQSITNITCNLTTTRELKQALIEIGIYCRWGFNSTKSGNYQSIKNEARKLISNSMEQFLGSDLNTFHNECRNYPNSKKIGKLILTENSEYQAIHRTLFQIDKSLNLQEPSSKQILKIPEIQIKDVILPESIISTSIALFPNLGLKNLLRSTMAIYNRDPSKLVELVHNRDFKWNNSYMSRFAGSNARAISSAARLLLINLCVSGNNSPMIPFYYCWSFEEPPEDSTTKLSTDLIDGQHLDLLGKKGIMTYSETSQMYLLFNNPLENANNIDFKSATTGLLHGYKILNNEVPSAPLIPLITLESCQAVYKDGEVFNTFFESKRITVVRDSSVSLSVMETINRQISRYDSLLNQQTTDLLRLKRKAIIAQEMESPLCTPLKKPRMEELGSESETEDMIPDDDFDATELDFM